MSKRNDDDIVLKCRCAGWRNNLPRVLKWAGGQRDYHGEAFVFCPWCSKRLTNRRALLKAYALLDAAP